MKKISLLLCILAFLNVSAQKSTPKPQKTESEKDWDALNTSFVALIKSIETNNKSAFTVISLPKVDCMDCRSRTDSHEGGSTVSTEIFFNDTAENFKTSPVYQAIIKKGYTFSIAIIKDFHPEYLPKSYPKDLKLYEVWVPTYLKNELSKGHPGTSHAFQFIKINGKFMFYGLTAIP